jgi:hypothetical protein
MATRQQEIEQHADRVDVGRRRDDVARRLLGRGVFRRQHARPIDRHGLCIQQPRDPEIQQFDGAVGRHENIRWLEIAMDDQVRVRMAHGVENLEDELEALFDGEPA